MNYWAIEPDWKGETVFVVAGGPSVADLDLTPLIGQRVIAINSSYTVAPFADVLFFGDQRWIDDHRNRPEFKSLPSLKVTTSRCYPEDKTLRRLRRVKPSPECGLATARDSVIFSYTSLHSALNIAVHKGSPRIVLLGADMCRAPDGRTHHHAPHRWRNKPGNATWDRQMEHLQFVVAPLKAAGVEVINASPVSRLDWWPRMTFAEALSYVGL